MPEMLATIKEKPLPGCSRKLREWTGEVDPMFGPEDLDGEVSMPEWEDNPTGIFVRFWNPIHRNQTRQTLKEISRYSENLLTSHYLPYYERVIEALKVAYPLSHWAACRVPRRWARMLVAERDQQAPPVEGWTVALTTTSRVLASPPDDNFVVLGLEKPHNKSAFANDADFFGGCIWLPI